MAEKLGELAQEIKSLRKKSGLSQASLAKACGVAQSYIAKLELAEKSFKIGSEFAQKLSDALGVTLAHWAPFTSDGHLIAVPEKQPEPETYTKPVLGTVSAGKGIDRAADRGEVMEVPYRLRNADSLYRVSGTSMVAAGIDDGDVIGVRDGSDAEHGEIVVAWLDDLEVCVIKMLENRVDGLAFLRGVNGEYQKPYKLREKDTILGTFVGKMSPEVKSTKKPAKGKK